MDKLSPERRSSNMRNIRSRNTLPELTVRSLIHRLGYRFRLHAAHLPGKPDIVFGSMRKVILVHGCFWHQHSGCIEGRPPGSRPEYWIPKLQRNQERDRSNRARLSRLGWRSLVIWECETKDEAKLSRKLARFLAD